VLLAALQKPDIVIGAHNVNVPSTGEKEQDSVVSELSMESEQLLVTAASPCKQLSEHKLNNNLPLMHGRIGQFS
jgi:hypothetical protein